MPPNKLKSLYYKILTELKQLARLVYNIHKKLNKSENKL
ncbi:hypothetical protein SRABI04_00569 [Chryseobacterium sp. Bi04]|nr:hypothetical protein SRABI04_00569 [Chryseobacterium sp. Bi04]